LETEKHRKYHHEAGNANRILICRVGGTIELVGVTVEIGGGLLN